MSRLSDDVGVSSSGGLTGLDVLEPRNGDEDSLNFRKGSEGWKSESLALFGELSWRLAFRWSGVGLRRFGYRRMAEAAQSPAN